MKILTYLITSIRAHHLIRLAIICLDHENWRYSIYIFQQYTYIVTCIYVSIREITTLWIYFKWWYFICIFSNISYLHLFLYHPIRIESAHWGKKRKPPIQCQSFFKLFEILKGWYILFPNISLKKRENPLIRG